MCDSRWRLNSEGRYIYTLCVRRAAAAASLRLGFSLYLQLPLLEGEPVMCSCLPLTLSITINADCVGERMNVQVFASCVSQMFAPIIKVSWAEPELVIIVRLLRTCRMDRMMYSSVCWLPLVPSRSEGQKPSCSASV